MSLSLNARTSAPSPPSRPDEHGPLRRDLAETRGEGEGEQGTRAEAGNPGTPEPKLRASSGIAVLDSLIDGGYPRGRTIVVCGDPGTGKTTLALQFLAAGVRAGEPGLLVLVDQKPRHVIEDARAFGWDLEHWRATGALLLLDASPYFSAKARRDPDPSELGSDLARQVKASGARRLVVDHFTSLVPHGSHTDVREFVRTLMCTLENELDCTMLLTAARSGGDDAVADLAGQIAAGVLDLDVASWREARVRRLRVRTLRGVQGAPIEIDVRLIDGEGLVGCGAGEASRPEERQA